MIKTEIKEIFVNIGEQRDVRAPLPFSVASLIDNDILPESCTAADSVSFCAYFTIEALPSDGEHILLRFHDLCRGYNVYFNGELTDALSQNKEQVTYDVTESVREGVNTLELRASAIDMLDAGVFGAIEIIRTQYAIIDSVLLSQTHEDGRVTVDIDVKTVGSSSDNVRAVATLISGSGEMYYSGLTKGHGRVTVTSPLYWWPAGVGIQNLYRLVISVYGDMEVEDNYEVRVGLRTLSNPTDTDSSLIEVNGVGVTPMGMVYRTPERRYIKSLEKQTEADLAAAAKAGVNTLFIPCDCEMPGEYFFELCDLYGIVALRESTDPVSEADALLRASKYASAGLVDVVADADKLESINASLTAEACAFIGLSEGQRSFDIFRLKSVGGCAKYPSVKALASYKTLCDRLFRSERNVFSRTVEDAAEGDMISILSGCAQRFLYAANIYDVSYISQLTEAYSAERAVMRSRISRGCSERAVIGALGRKGGVVGDGPIDCNGRAKALAYRASRFFAPIVAYAENNGASVRFYLSNESRNDFCGTLICKIINSKNELIHIESVDCSCGATSAEQVYTADFSGIISGHEHEYYLEYELKSDNTRVSGGVLLFVAEKRFAYEDPNIRAEIFGSDRKFSITLTADAFAQGVEIDFEGHNVVFYDNFIDVTTNMPIKLSFGVVGGTTTADKLTNELRIKSVYDIGKTYI